VTSFDDARDAARRKERTIATTTGRTVTTVRALLARRGLGARNLSGTTTREGRMDAFVIRRARREQDANDETTPGERTTKRPKAVSGSRWRALDGSLLVRDDAECATVGFEKIAGFDLDGTLQRTISGRKAFMAEPNDFTFLNGEVRRVLRSLSEDGYKICIFSNQGSVKGALEGKKATDVRIRLARLADELGVPFQAFCATQVNKPGKPMSDPHNYRKGETGMWKRMVRSHNGGVTPDLTKCFFVGDAAGRPDDHSDVDLQFARGVGIKFYTPEEFFVEGKDVWRD
jgi:bifunctional polynucleotide phosphatase/kinase